MFRCFFLNGKWRLWAWLGTAVVLAAIWFKVELDVKINEWFGMFYDWIQEILKSPNSVTFPQFWARLLVFAKIAGVSIALTVLLDFFGKHYIFRWRSAMTEYYEKNWHWVRQVEGASQRIQEDTMRFARTMEALGESFIRAVLTLVAFLPLLWTLSEKVTVLPWVGRVPHSLVFVALVFSIVGTVVLATVRVKLPGLEYNNQRVEAAYRKELVLGEDDVGRAQPENLRALFGAVRRNNFVLYAHYICILIWCGGLICSLRWWCLILRWARVCWRGCCRWGCCNRWCGRLVRCRMRFSFWCCLGRRLWS